MISTTPTKNFSAININCEAEDSCGSQSSLELDKEDLQEQEIPKKNIKAARRHALAKESKAKIDAQIVADIKRQSMSNADHSRRNQRIEDMRVYITMVIIVLLALCVVILKVSIQNILLTLMKDENSTAINS